MILWLNRDLGAKAGAGIPNLSIEYTQRSEKRFADALATLGSQVSFRGRDTLIRIGKQEHSIIRILQKMYPRESK